MMGVRVRVSHVTDVWIRTGGDIWSMVLERDEFGKEEEEEGCGNRAELCCD